MVVASTRLVSTYTITDVTIAQTAHITVILFICAYLSTLSSAVHLSHKMFKLMIINKTHHI